MNTKKEAREIIRTLEDNQSYAECPCPDCGEQFLLRDAGLFFLDDFSPEAEKLYQQRIEELKEYEKKIREMRKKIQKTSQIGAEATNIGFLLERLAPCMRAFPFERNDCRPLFDPIDYIVFEGLTKGGPINKIVFMEIKTGKPRLTGSQPEIRSLVERKRVIWDTYSIEMGK
jgi:predicted Holliday junction resolvase-like endonuclease